MQIRERVGGLDSLRFVLACVVTLGHIGLPIDVDPSECSPPFNYLAAIYANCFNGPAAVVVFFIISGFCIHFPQRVVSRIDLLPYFARRHIRIWVPILVALWLAKSIGYRTQLLGNSILWSLIAEEIYYLIYPVLLGIGNRFGWGWTALGSVVPAFVLVLTNPTAQNYPSFGILGNWVLGLPAWLTGCWIAATFESNLQTVGLVKVYFWRLVVLALFTMTSILRFHLSIGYPWSLSIIVIPMIFWLKSELSYLKDSRGAFEKLGCVTYSLYLTHLIFAHLLKQIGFVLPSCAAGRILYFFSIFLLAYLFYLTVEFPSHMLARWISSILRKRFYSSPEPETIANTRR